MVDFFGIFFHWVKSCNFNKVKNHNLKGDKMKCLIASDIHGSAYWAKYLAKGHRATATDKIVLLGGSALSWSTQ